jgi:hypothetical protein
VPTSKKKVNRAGLIGSFIAAFIILGAGATGIGVSAAKQTLGSEFNKSYNMRFELSPYDEQSYGSDKKLIDGSETFTNQAKDCADAYSKLLHEKGIDNVNVYPE